MFRRLKNILVHLLPFTIFELCYEFYIAVTYCKKKYGKYFAGVTTEEIERETGKYLPLSDSSRYYPYYTALIFITIENIIILSMFL
jgi:hypothetical protein